MSKPTLNMIEVDKLIPTPDNPRILRKNQAFAELVQSIKTSGVLQPLIARPIEGPIDDSIGQLFDLRAGHRRLAAAKEAGLATVPVMVSEMDDKTAMEVTVSENLQRENLHPLEESQGIQRLLDIGWDVQAIADRLGKSAGWVARRAKLLDLSDAWCKAITDLESPLSLWPATLLERIARLPEAIQSQVLENYEDGFFEPIPSAQQLDLQIARDYLQTLGGAPWQLDDETLIPEVGACAACQKRSSCQPLLFEGLEDAIAGNKKKKPVAQDRCLDQGCYGRKMEAYVHRRHVELKQQHDNLIMVPANMTGWSEIQKLKKVWPKLVEHHDVEACKKSTSGALPAMVVSGAGAGTLRWVKPHIYSSAKKRVTAAMKSGDDAKPTPLKERRQQLTNRRRSHVIKAIIEHIEDDGFDFAPCLTDLSLATAVVLAFGTDHTHSHRGERYEYDSGVVGKDRKVDDWQRLRGAQNMQPAELGRRLVAAILPVLVSRIQIFNVGDVETAWPETKRVCELLGVDLKPFESAAAEAIPEPKSWAKLKADGTPKSTKRKGKNVA